MIVLELLPLPTVVVSFAPVSIVGDLWILGPHRLLCGDSTVAADVKRAAGLGCEWITFDMPKADVPGMLAVMERFAKEVKPAAA